MYTTNFPHEDLPTVSPCSCNSRSDSLNQPFLQSPSNFSLWLVPSTSHWEQSPDGWIPVVSWTFPNFITWGQPLAMSSSALMLSMSSPSFIFILETLNLLSLTRQFWPRTSPAAWSHICKWLTSDIEISLGAHNRILPPWWELAVLEGSTAIKQWCWNLLSLGSDCQKGW